MPPEITNSKQMITLKWFSEPYQGPQTLRSLELSGGDKMEVNKSTVRALLKENRKTGKHTVLSV